MTMATKSLSSATASSPLLHHQQSGAQKQDTTTRTSCFAKKSIAGNPDTRVNPNLVEDNKRLAAQKVSTIRNKKLLAASIVLILLSVIPFFFHLVALGIATIIIALLIIGTMWAKKKHFLIKTNFSYYLLKFFKCSKTFILLQKKLFH